MERTPEADPRFLHQSGGEDPERQPPTVRRESGGPDYTAGALRSGFMSRPCPKCGAPVVMTPKRLEHSRYLCNKCSASVVREWGERNRERFLASARRRVKKYQAAHPERRPSPEAKSTYDRSHRLMQKYGITAAEYDSRLAAQSGGCALCASQDPKNQFGFFHVDHCHQSGRV